MWQARQTPQPLRAVARLCEDYMPAAAITRLRNNTYWAWTGTSRQNPAKHQQRHHVAFTWATGRRITQDEHWALHRTEIYRRHGPPFTPRPTAASQCLSSYLCITRALLFNMILVYLVKSYHKNDTHTQVKPGSIWVVPALNETRRGFAVLAHLPIFVGPR